MPVRSDGSHLGPHWQIVRWRLARFGFLCFPHSDGAYNGVFAYDANGVNTGPNRNLLPAPTGGRVQPTQSNGLRITYGNRYWHDGRRVLSWWGSPSKYAPTDNYGEDARWNVFMTPMDPSGGAYNQQPTRFSETFYGDYFWISRPPDFIAEGPYQARSIAPPGSFTANGFPTGNSADFEIRPINPAVRYQGRAVLWPDPDLGQIAGAAILETSSGPWVLAVEQPRWDINVERLVACRLDGSDRRVVLSWTWDMPLDDNWGARNSYFRNYSPWTFRRDGARAVAFRENLSRLPSGSVGSDPSFWELSIGWNQSGNPVAVLDRITFLYPPAVGDWMITLDRGLVLLAETDVAALGPYGQGWGLTFEGTGNTPDARALAGMDYDDAGVLRPIWTAASFFEGGAFFDAPALRDDRDAICNGATVQHVDAREGVVLMRSGGTDQRYILWWDGVLIWDYVLPGSQVPDHDGLGGAAIELRSVATNGVAALSRDRQYLAVSTPLMVGDAMIPWDPITGFFDSGDWWNNREWHTAVYRRDPVSGDITEVLSATEIAGLVGLPGANARLHPVIPS